MSLISENTAADNTDPHPGSVVRCCPVFAPRSVNSFSISRSSSRIASNRRALRRIWLAAVGLDIGSSAGEGLVIQDGLTIVGRRLSRRIRALGNSCQKTKAFFANTLANSVRYGLPQLWWRRAWS